MVRSGLRTPGDVCVCVCVWLYEYRREAMMDGWMEHTNGCYVCSSAFFFFFLIQKKVIAMLEMRVLYVCSTLW